MSAKQFSGLVASILGFVILIIGSLGYMDVFALSDTLSYMLMGVGIIMVISALAFISLMGRKEELTSLKEECDMGLMDKLKSLFKKSDKKDAAPKLNGTKMEAVQFKGEGRVPDALRYAANKLDAKVKAGKFDDKRASAFIAQLRECEASSLSDDEKLVQIGQIIGAITFL